MRNYDASGRRVLCLCCDAVTVVNTQICEFLWYTIHRTTVCITIETTQATTINSSFDVSEKYNDPRAIEILS